MNINDKMQPTSSASSADERAKFEAWALSVRDDKFPDLSRDDLDPDAYWQQRTNTSWETWKARAAIVPPVVQAPIAYVNSDDLDNMLDDRTAEIQSNKSGWRGTPLYATPHALVSHSEDQIDKIFVRVCEELERSSEGSEEINFSRAFARALLAAPIVATVPSEPFAWIDQYALDELRDNDQFCSISTRIYCHILKEGKTPLYAAPSPIEQASDVRNAALERAAERCDTHALYQHRNGNMGEASTADYLAKEIRALKSATPADKGNAPAEAKSSQGAKQ